MSAKILCSKKLFEDLKKKIKVEVSTLQSQPLLLVVLIGQNPASYIYVNHKKNSCAEVGIQCTVEQYPESISEDHLIQVIETHSRNPEIHGILIQFPLPSHIQTKNIIECIHPHKDVDGFHPYNLGRLAAGFPLLRPCTPYGIIQLLEYYQIPLEGIDALVIGTSRIVGRPMGLELLMAQATVTFAHNLTTNLAKKIQDHQLIIVATGKRNLINCQNLNPHQIIIDVGIHKDVNGKICGDIDFELAKNRVQAITPVPGGVGPMTIVSLLENVLQAYRLQNE